LKSAPLRSSALKPRDTDAIAAAAVRNWDSTRSRLAPIVGEDGFRLLYARSLHRARIKHPWLAREMVQGNNPFSMLKASLESQSTEHAEEGSRALTTNFNELLNALIGEELASRLLGPLQD
jgi:hypothetical protein